ncbi:Crinkler (CRN) [Phytophthora megakarya]|uniref:Crinkler (CRN) n=1 Tax=Phytophthora megakarya TaxID=4795 RepID=A0A225WNY8_9STRA|nr:Crinkler (CRN) [Phytophthora megakarya]
MNVMTRCAHNPEEKNYWVPASNLCKTVGAVAKWNLYSDKTHSVQQLCLLQTTLGNIELQFNHCKIAEIQSMFAEVVFIPSD